LESIKAASESASHRITLEAFERAPAGGQKLLRRTDIVLDPKRLLLDTKSRLSFMMAVRRKGAPIYDWYK